MSREFTRDEIQAAHAKSRNHWDLLKKSTYSACFSCGDFFFSDKIRDFTDANNTALCPFCGADAVLPHVEGENEFGAPLVRAMQAHYFGDTPATDPLLIDHVEGKA